MAKSPAETADDSKSDIERRSMVRGKVHRRRDKESNVDAGA